MRRRVRHARRSDAYVGEIVEPSRPRCRSQGILSPLRLPVPPSRHFVEVLDSTANFTLYVFFVYDSECETVQVNVKVFMDFHRFLSLAHEVFCGSPRATMSPWLSNHEDIRTRFYHSTHSHSSALSIAAHFSQSAREMGHPSYCGSEKI